ncbi:hypothetical protein OT109_01910 [Phycisphaeraceae bacterium D3-23]
MSISRRVVVLLVLAVLLVGVLVFVLTRGPAEEQIAIAYSARPPTGLAAQARPDLLQNVFRFPRPVALKSVRLVYLDAAALADDGENVEGVTVWLLEPDPLFEPDAAQADGFRSGASVKTEVLSLGDAVPGMVRVDDAAAGPVRGLVAGGRYRLEVAGEGLEGSYEFVATPYRRR